MYTGTSKMHLKHVKLDSEIEVPDYWFKQCIS